MARQLGGGGDAPAALSSRKSSSSAQLTNRPRYAVRDRGAPQLVRAQLIDEFGVDPAKTATLYNGVDLERFRPPGPAERARWRQMYEVETGAPVVAKKNLRSLDRSDIPE